MPKNIYQIPACEIRAGALTEEEQELVRLELQEELAEVEGQLDNNQLERTANES
jgi:hypothetical protein